MADSDVFEHEIAYENMEKNGLFDTDYESDEIAAQ